jgi:hypothetical protein
VHGRGHIQSETCRVSPRRPSCARVAFSARPSQLANEALASPEGSPSTQQLQSRTPSLTPRTSEVPAGRLGDVWQIRRSAPSPRVSDASRNLLGCGAVSTRTSQHMIDGLAQPNDGWPSLAAGHSPSVNRCAPPLEQRDARVRRPRRAMDISASSTHHRASCSFREVGSAAVDAAAASPITAFRREGLDRPVSFCADATVVPTSTQQSLDGADLRSTSTPPTGASKEEADTARKAKCRAVAALQRLFFEELASRDGLDANGAAAAALRRLTEVPATALPQGEPNTLAATAQDASFEDHSASQATAFHTRPIPSPPSFGRPRRPRVRAFVPPAQG